MKITLLYSAVMLASLLSACTGASKNESSEAHAPGMIIKEESVTYTVDSVTMHGFIAYNDSDGANVLLCSSCMSGGD